MKLVVDSEFVREAYDAACENWKKKLVEKFPELLMLSQESISTLPSYREYKIVSSYGSTVTFGKDFIEIALPVANTGWTLLAWKLATEICEKYQGCYPRHSPDYDCRVIHIIVPSYLRILS